MIIVIKRNHWPLTDSDFHHFQIYIYVYSPQIDSPPDRPRPIPVRSWPSLPSHTATTKTVRCWLLKKNVFSFHFNSFENKFTQKFNRWGHCVVSECSVRSFLKTDIVNLLFQIVFEIKGKKLLLSFRVVWTTHWKWLSSFRFFLLQILCLYTVN